MEPGYPHGMNSLYDQDRQRRWDQSGLPNFQSQFPDGASQPGAQTLPPIQSQRPGGYDPATNAFEPASRRPPAIYTTHGGPFPNYVAHTSQPYPHGLPPQFAATSSMLSQPQPALSMPMTHGGYGAPAPAGYPQIRPVPTPPTSQGPSMPPGYPGATAFGFPQPGDEDLSQRTHVVGSQVRRGILPSADGKSNPMAVNGSPTAKTNVMPQKDADGKFPCPHCQKTYLHGKHLKRHLLRHTGDRPYSCFLCNDTFSRSDILKRHFQKCSIRRGNPTGATHLDHAHSHLNKNKGAKKPPTPNAIDTGFPGGPSGGSQNASPIFSETGMGMPVGGTPTQMQADAHAKPYGEDPHGADRTGLGTPASAMNRSAFGYVPTHNGSGSLPSSGSSTPHTAKGNGQFPGHFSADVAQQRAHQYNDMHQRHDPTHMANTAFDGSSFD